MDLKPFVLCTIFVFIIGAKGKNNDCRRNEDYRYMGCEKVCNVNLACLQYKHVEVEARFLDLFIGGTKDEDRDVIPKGCYCKTGFILNNLRDMRCIQERRCPKLINLKHVTQAYEMKYNEKMPNQIKNLLEDVLDNKLM